MQKCSRYEYQTTEISTTINTSSTTAIEATKAATATTAAAAAAAAAVATTTTITEKITISNIIQNTAISADCIRFFWLTRDLLNVRWLTASIHVAVNTVTISKPITKDTQSQGTTFQAYVIFLKQNKSINIFEARRILPCGNGSTVKWEVEEHCWAITHNRIYMLIAMLCPCTPSFFLRYFGNMWQSVKPFDPLMRESERYVERPQVKKAAN